MENDRFIMIDENENGLSEKSKGSITNNEKLDILTKMIQEVDKKVENDNSVKKLIK